MFSAGLNMGCREVEEVFVPLPRARLVVCWKDVKPTMSFCPVSHRDIPQGAELNSNLSLTEAYLLIYPQSQQSEFM